MPYCTAAPGCDEAWRTVCDGDLDLIANLEALVEQSLVRATATEAEQRYFLLDTIRAYVAERLIELAQQPLLQERHARYYASFAEQADPHLHSDQQLAWLARLDLEAANVRAALEWASSHQADRQAHLHSATPRLTPHGRPGACLPGSRRQMRCWPGLRPTVTRRRRRDERAGLLLRCLGAPRRRLMGNPLGRQSIVAFIASTCVCGMIV
jgi:hypothetical protein